jgi:hypothetical protein
MIVSRLALVAALTLGLSFVPAPQLSAENAIDDVTAARQKINLSGRQRMLSQRMSASVCLTISGADDRFGVASAALDEFATALVGLKDGNADLMLTVEPNAPIRTGIEVVEGTWEPFQTALQQMLAGDVSDAALEQLLNGNLTLLAQSNAVVTLFEETYGAGVMDPDMATTINVAGRQRMLSQKMTKELCFIAAGFEAEKNRESLSKTVALFDRSLGHLKSGSAAEGVAPPPDGQVAAQLETVAALWADIKPRMDAAASGDTSFGGELASIAGMTDTLLVEMNRAVSYYVSAGG